MLGRFENGSEELDDLDSRNGRDDGPDGSGGDANGDGGILHDGPGVYPPGDNGGREPEGDNEIRFPLPGPGDDDAGGSGPTEDAGPTQEPPETDPGPAGGFEWAPWLIAVGLFVLYRYRASRFDGWED